MWFNIGLTFNSVFFIYSSNIKVIVKINQGILEPVY